LFITSRIVRINNNFLQEAEPTEDDPFLEENLANLRWLAANSERVHQQHWINSLREVAVRFNTYKPRRNAPELFAYMLRQLNAAEEIEELLEQ